MHAGNPCPGPDGDGNCAESCSEQGANCVAGDGPAPVNCFPGLVKHGQWCYCPDGSIPDTEESLNLIRDHVEQARSMLYRALYSFVVDIL